MFDIPANSGILLPMISSDPSGQRKEIANESFHNCGRSEGIGVAGS